MNFGRLKSRDKTLIEKGGNETLTVANLNSEFLNPNKELILERQSKILAEFDKINNRMYKGSIY